MTLMSPYKRYSLVLMILINLLLVVYDAIFHALYQSNIVLLANSVQ